MGNGRKPAQIIAIYIVGLTVLTVFFLNCQRQIIPSFEADATMTSQPLARTPSSENNRSQKNSQTNFKTEIEAVQAPFENGKVQFASHSAFASKVSSGLIQTGDRWIVLLSNTCAHQNPGPLSRQVFKTEFYNDQLETQSYLWKSPTELTLAALQELANSDECIIGLNPDGLATSSEVINDPLLAQAPGLRSIGLSDSYSFFNNAKYGAKSSVVVAVIDSGINHSHEDLHGNLWTDSTGEYYGFNFRTNTNFVYDDFGHGTKVSSLIAAQSNNGLGISGVLGHNMKLMALKVQDQTGSAYVSDIVRAIDFARSQNVDVINISMEGRGSQPTLQAAINAAVTNGAVMVFAAGNSGIQITNDESMFVYPAGYASSVNGAIAVGATDASSGLRSSFSNYGVNYIEIGAPGSNGILMADKNGGYSKDDGTSFSSPQVAGAAALVISFFKKNQIAYTPALVESVLLSSAVQNSSLQSYFGGGRVLDLRALAAYLQRNYLLTHDGGFNEN